MFDGNNCSIRGISSGVTSNIPSSQQYALGIFAVVNVDATIIAQKPKMRPYIDTMRQNIADALMIDISQVNVKATTEEGLGFTGSGEGIAAQAVCMLYR